jgi:hypothetical protein
MRLIMWILTVLFALAGLALRADGGFVGAARVAQGLLIIAVLACPLLWARPHGLVPDALAFPGKSRLMLALALLLSTPLTLPWQLWLAQLAG